jgi:hypothetical protein
MRKLIFIIVLFFSTSAFAELAEVYFCEQIKNVGIVAEKEPPPGIFEVKPEDQFRFEEFLNLKFSFKVTKEKIIFNKDRDNIFKNMELPIINDYSQISSFDAADKSTYVSFSKGHLFFTANFGIRGTALIYAKCESF